jgi:hypothetical protein
MIRDVRRGKEGKQRSGRMRKESQALRGSGEEAYG